MSSFPYSSFQIIFGRSDPRTALIFSHPFEVIYPHIITMGQELRCPIVRYPPPQHSRNEDDDLQGQGQQPPQHHHHHRSFAEVFEECFNEGKWLVVDSIGRVEHMSWRHVGGKLAVTVPSAKHHLRKHFRLFTFLTSGQDVHVYVPPIMLQFALVVDTGGMVHAKSSVGPLFATDTMVDDINQVLSSRQLLNGRDGGDGGGTDGGAFGAGGSGRLIAARDETNRNNPYVSGSKARLLARGTSDGFDYDDEDGDGGSGAMTDLYIDEALAELKETLLAEQEELIHEVDKATTQRVAELDRRLATRMGILGEVAEADEAAAANKDGDGSGGPLLASGGIDPSNYDADRARTEIIEEEMRKANDNFEWIYPSVQRWAIKQCPTIDKTSSAMQTVPNDEVTKDHLLWQTSTETCHNGVWCGSDVLIKSPLLGYSTEKNNAYQQAFRSEAALHARQRHPHVLALYGVLESDKCTMILEDAVGTVEQTFMRAREHTRHWKVRDYLQLAQHVLRGMQYLASRVTHRDISARSIVEVKGGSYKIANFQCAYPVRAQAPERTAMVPIRWSSPEALCGRFSVKSDVWGFGVLMWECLHYCCELPYSRYPQAADAILEGKTLECRTAAAKIIFDMLCEPCFEYEVAHRPSAADLLSSVDRALYQLDPHVLDRRIPMPGDSDQKETFTSPTPP